MNIVKRMMQRAVLALLFIGALSIVATTKSWAAYVSLSSQSVTAGADFSGVPATFSFATQLKNISGDTNASSMTWTGVAPGSNTWRAANQYIQVTANSTYPGWGVQIYTNNKHSAANPQYTGSANPAGLVSAVGTQALPLGWRVLDNTTSYATVNDPKLRADASGWVNYDYHYVKDLQTPTTGQFVNSEDYVSVVGEQGMHYGEGPADWGARADNVQNVYVICNFQNALATLYKTSTLTLEMFHD